MRWAGLVAGALSVLVFAAPASASRIWLEDTINGRSSFWTLHYQAAPGERNDVTVSAVAGDPMDVTLTDPGATLEINAAGGLGPFGPIVSTQPDTMPALCVAAQHEVHCRINHHANGDNFADLVGVHLELRDGDDTARLGGQPPPQLVFSVDCGDGADTVFADPVDVWSVVGCETVGPS